MNPIEFLQKNGLNPDNFRTDAHGAQVPLFAAKYNSSCIEVRERKAVHKKRVPRRRDILDVRNDVFNEWFTTGNHEITGIFVPYLLLDVFQIVDYEYLQKVDFTHKERKHYTALMNTYSTFNKVFFSRLCADKKDKVVDMMDAFGDYIHNHIEIFRLNIESTIMSLPEDFRLICGALCVCKFMISQARVAWEAIYKGQKLCYDIDTHHIKSMEYHIARLMEEYFSRCSHELPEDIWFSDSSDVRHAEKNTVKQILEFLKEYDRQQSNG
jgi:hypothetical protein